VVVTAGAEPATGADAGAATGAATGAAAGIAAEERGRSPSRNPAPSSAVPTVCLGGRVRGRLGCILQEDGNLSRHRLQFLVGCPRRPGLRLFPRCCRKVSEYKSPILWQVNYKFVPDLVRITFLTPTDHYTPLRVDPPSVNLEEQ
jgi:hypothetical protein